MFPNKQVSMSAHISPCCNSPLDVAHHHTSNIFNSSSSSINNSSSIKPNSNTLQHYSTALHYRFTVAPSGDLPIHNSMFLRQVEKYIIFYTCIDQHQSNQVPLCIASTGRCRSSLTESKRTTLPARRRRVAGLVTRITADARLDHARCDFHPIDFTLFGNGCAKTNA